MGCPQRYLESDEGGPSDARTAAVMGGKWNEVDVAIAGLDVEQLIARHQLSAAALVHG